MRFFQFLSLSTFALLLSFSHCSIDRGELGSEENPIKFFLLPSVDTVMLTQKAPALKKYLEANTPYQFKLSVPQSYMAVVEAFGSERADMAAINTFGYILANDRYGVEARILVERYGESTYKAQIIARADSKVKKLEDINGKKFAYVDFASTSGFLMPAKLFKEKGITPGSTEFAKKHDTVVSLVYQGAVDAGATFHSPIAEGKIQDARRLVKTQFPDVEEKVKIIALTDSIPNDPIVVRKGIPEEMKNKIVDVLINFIKTEEGRELFNAMYGATNFLKTTDSQYDTVRKMLKELGADPYELITKNKKK